MAANRTQTSVDGPLRPIADFGCCSQERVTNIRQGAGDSSKSRLMTAKARHLRRRLDELNEHRHHSRIQVRSIHDTLDHKELELSALATEYYGINNERHRVSSDTDYKQGTKSGRTSDYCGSFPMASTYEVQ